MHIRNMLLKFGFPGLQSMWVSKVQKIGLRWLHKAISVRTFIRLVAFAIPNLPNTDSEPVFITKWINKMSVSSYLLTCLPARLPQALHTRCNFYFSTYFTINYTNHSPSKKKSYAFYELYGLHTGALQCCVFVFSLHYYE